MLKNMINRIKKMTNIHNGLESCQSGYVNIPAPPPGTEKGYITIEYGDKYGNKYATIVLVDFKKIKILKQEFRKVKIVKDTGDKIPRLEIDEESLKMVMSNVNRSNTEIVKEK